MKVMLSLLMVFFCFSLAAQVIPYQELPTPASKPGLDLVLEYTSPRDEVVIRNGKITHISKTYHYDEERPYVATPVGVSSRTIANATPLNGQQLNAFKEQINSSGIMNLSQKSFGAPYGERSYDYSLRISMNGRQQEIVFRSNPSYSNAPYPFELMKEYIWRLVAEVER